MKKTKPSLVTPLLAVLILAVGAMVWTLSYSNNENLAMAELQNRQQSGSTICMLENQIPSGIKVNEKGEAEPTTPEGEKNLEAIREASNPYENLRPALVIGCRCLEKKYETIERPGPFCYNPHVSRPRVMHRVMSDAKACDPGTPMVCQVDGSSLYDTGYSLRDWSDPDNADKIGPYTTYRTKEDCKKSILNGMANVKVEKNKQGVPVCRLYGTNGEVVFRKEYAPSPALTDEQYLGNCKGDIAEEIKPSVKLEVYREPETVTEEKYVGCKEYECVPSPLKEGRRYPLVPK